jgi:predicted GNAT family acetyltransferase
MDKKPYAVINNEKNLRFEISEVQEIAYLEYRYFKKAIALMHTLVPEALNGKGIAYALAHYAFEWARGNRKRVIVYCPFVAAYLKRHPEYNDIVDKPGNNNLFDHRK